MLPKFHLGTKSRVHRRDFGALAQKLASIFVALHNNSQSKRLVSGLHRSRAAGGGRAAGEGRFQQISGVFLLPLDLRSCSVTRMTLGVTRS